MLCRSESLAFKKLTKRGRSWESTLTRRFPHKNNLINRSHPPESVGETSTSNALRSASTFSFIILPLVSFVAFPSMIDKVTNFDLPVFERQISILGLLLSKRIYLYIIGLSTIYLISKQSIEDAEGDTEFGFGRRLSKLNDEVFPFLSSEIKKYDENTDDRSFYEMLNKNITGKTEAIFIPVLVSVCLIISFAYTSFKVNFGSLSFGSTVGDNLIGFTNLCVCVAFSRIQIKNLITQLNLPIPQNATDITSVIIAGVFSFIAAMSPPNSSLWPFFNVINQCIALVVGRLLQVPKLTFVAFTLLGLTLYDFLAVTSTSQLTDGGMSVMELVAREKISALGETAASSTDSIITSSQDAAELKVSYHGLGSWRPGLFDVIVGGRISDAFGLGDVTFPSMLSGWAARFDNMMKSKYGKSSSLFLTSMVGYALGCLLLDIFQTGQGQPALVYIVPTMSICLLAIAVKENIINILWESELTWSEGEEPVHVQDEGKK